MAQRTHKIKMVLCVLVVVCITAIAWTFYQQRQAMSTVKIPLPASSVKALIALSSVHQTATKDGVVQWELDAKSAELEADTGRMVLDAPEVEFNLEDGTKVHLTARKGILFTRNNNIQVRGNVRLINDRYTLVTEVLTYEHAQRLLHTDTPVKITGQAFDLSSAKMTYDLNANQAQLAGDVNGVIYEKPAI
jgi:LPS export ABC transporter protein LptC